MGRTEVALADFQAAAQARPSLAEAQYKCGALLHQQGKLESALLYFDSAIAAKLDLVAALLNRSSVLIELRRFDEALADTVRALELKPEFPLGKVCKTPGQTCLPGREVEATI